MIENIRPVSVETFSEYNKVKRHAVLCRDEHSKKHHVESLVAELHAARCIYYACDYWEKVYYIMQDEQLNIFMCHVYYFVPWNVKDSPGIKWDNVEVTPAARDHPDYEKAYNLLCGCGESMAPVQNGNNGTVIITKEDSDICDGRIITCPEDETKRVYENLGTPDQELLGLWEKDNGGAHKYYCTKCRRVMSKNGIMGASEGSPVPGYHIYERGLRQFWQCGPLKIYSPETDINKPLYAHYGVYKGIPVESEEHKRELLEKERDGIPIP